MHRFFATDDSPVLLAQRVALGLVILPHGLQKTLGWFGGYGFSGTMAAFTADGMPAVLAFLVIVAESLGALGLVAGLLTRLSAAGIAAVMVGAIAMVHWPNGFFMNWFGGQAGEGFEYHLLVLTLALPLVVLGGGRAAADGWIASRFAAATPAPSRPLRRAA